VVPCHYGTFDLLAQDPSEFVAAMGATPKVVALKIGQSLEL
jgi:L-ascorbate metabolism protein UlaG (beta-lactamase superfamily)